jgi:cell division protein FtsW (lipid II flippase)
LLKFSDKIINGLKSQGVSIALGLLLLPLIVILVARSRILEPLSVLCAILTPRFGCYAIFGQGSDQHGATLWISVGGMSLQLTEFAKITYNIVLASFFKSGHLKTSSLFSRFGQLSYLC